MRISELDVINTVNDVVHRNITIFQDTREFEDMRNYYKEQHTQDWDHVANTMVKSAYCHWEVTGCREVNGAYQYHIKYHVHGNKTHAFVKGYLDDMELIVLPEKKNWWRSEKVLTASNPYYGLMTSRNWILNEVNFSV